MLGAMRTTVPGGFFFLNRLASCRRELFLFLVRAVYVVELDIGLVEVAAPEVPEEPEAREAGEEGSGDGAER